MASIDRVAGGYKVRWREGGRGSKQLASPVLTTKAAALDFKTRLEERLRAKIPLGSRAGVALPMGELLNRWVGAKQVGNEPTDYLDIARSQLTALCDRRGWRTAADITPPAVVAWRADQKGKNARLGAVLRAVLRWAMEQCEQPVDPRTLIALRPPKAKRKPRGALPEDHVLEGYRQTCEAMGMAALFHVLTLYGWRPISAARMLVRDIDVSRASVRIDAKGAGVYDCPLWPQTVDLLAPLLVDESGEPRQGGEHVFICPTTGRPFHLRGGISDWWRACISGKQNVYDLKRLAITRMLAGSPPWPRALTVAEVKTFTGHISDSQVLVYQRAAQRDLRALFTTPESVEKPTRSREHRGSTARRTPANRAPFARRKSL